MLSTIMRRLTPEGRRQHRLKKAHLTIEKDVIAWMEERLFPPARHQWIRVSALSPDTCQIRPLHGRSIDDSHLYLEVSYDIGTPVIMTIVFDDAGTHVRTDWPE